MVEQTTRIAGVTLDKNKHIGIALQSVYGIGNSTSIELCKNNSIDQTIKVKDLTDDQLELLRRTVAKYTVEGDLRRLVAMNIKRLKDLKTYRGSRHRLGLPLNGQRTKTNAKTRKGKKKSK